MLPSFKNFVLLFLVLNFGVSGFNVTEDPSTSLSESDEDLTATSDYETSTTKGRYYAALPPSHPPAPLDGPHDQLPAHEEEPEATFETGSEPEFQLDVRGRNDDDDLFRSNKLNDSTLMTSEDSSNRSRLLDHFFKAHALASKVNYSVVESSHPAIQDQSNVEELLSLQSLIYQYKSNSQPNSTQEQPELGANETSVEGRNELPEALNISGRAPELMKVFEKIANRVKNETEQIKEQIKALISYSKANHSSPINYTSTSAPDSDEDLNEEEEILYKAAAANVSSVTQKGNITGRCFHDLSQMHDETLKDLDRVKEALKDDSSYLIRLAEAYEGRNNSDDKRQRKASVEFTNTNISLQILHTQRPNASEDLQEVRQGRVMARSGNFEGSKCNQTAEPLDQRSFNSTDVEAQPENRFFNVSLSDKENGRFFSLLNGTWQFFPNSSSEQTFARQSQPAQLPNPEPMPESQPTPMQQETVEPKGSDLLGNETGELAFRNQDPKVEESDSSSNNGSELSGKFIGFFKKTTTPPVTYPASYYPLPATYPPVPLPNNPPYFGYNVPIIPVPNNPSSYEDSRPYNQRLTHATKTHRVSTARPVYVPINTYYNNLPYNYPIPKPSHTRDQHFQDDSGEDQDDADDVSDSRPPKTEGCSSSRDCSRRLSEVCVRTGFHNYCGCQVTSFRNPITGVCQSKVSLYNY